MESLRFIADSDEDNDNFMDNFAALVIDGHISGFGESEESGGNNAKQVRQPRQNKNRNFDAAHRRFHRFLFWTSHVYDGKHFESRLRIPRRLFRRIDTMVRGCSLFVQQKDAIAKIVIHPQTKIIAAICVLAYGMDFCLDEELFELSAS